MKKIKLFLALTLGSLISVSCVVDDNVEEIGGGSSVLVGFSAPTLAANFVTDGEVKPYSIPVNVIGGNQGLPSSANVTVNWELASTSTATAGVEFDFVSSASNVVIPAGSLSTVIPITVNTDALVVGDDKTVVINLTSVVSDNGVVLATNRSTVTLTLVAACFSDLAGQYYWNYTTGPAYFTISELSPGVYRATQFPFFTAIYWFEFSDVCDNLTMTTWQFQAANPLYGTTTAMPVGTVQPNGNLLFTGINVTGTTVTDRTITAFKVN